MVTSVHTNPTAVLQHENVGLKHNLPQEELHEQARSHLTTILQTTLELPRLLELFYENIQPFVPIGGLVFRNVTQKQPIRFGHDCTHQGEYRLITTQDNLGELVFSRNRRFSEYELTTIEVLISTLIYPLRNAIKYNEVLIAAAHDPLTGVGNRAAFDNTLQHELELARRYQQPLSLLVIDIDHFKKINDNFGHTLGDKVLQQVANTIETATRKTDLTFRYGGEEFVVIMNSTTEQGAAVIAERIREEVQLQSLKNHPHDITFTVSIGCSSLEPEQSAQRFFECADLALYRAKQAGRNQIALATRVP